MTKVSDEPWTIHRDAEFDRHEAMARNLERLAWLMDRAFRIPGTRISGWDAVSIRGTLMGVECTCLPWACAPPGSGRRPVVRSCQARGKDA